MNEPTKQRLARIMRHINAELTSWAGADRPGEEMGKLGIYLSANDWGWLLNELKGVIK